VGCRHPRSQIETPPYTWEGASHFPCLHIHSHPTLVPTICTSQPWINSTHSDPSTHHQLWQTPNDPQRHPERQLPPQRSRPNKYAAWKKPAYEPKPSAPNNSKTNNHRAPQPAPKMPKHRPKSQAKSDQRPPPSLQQSETPVAPPAATMASQHPTTPPSAPRANFRSTSITTSAR
jgi:hypothetical protein